MSRPPRRPLPRRPLASAVALLLSAGLLTGCGGGEEETAEPEEQAAAETAPVGPQPAAPAEPVSPFGTFRLLTPQQAGAVNHGTVTIEAGEGDAPPTLTAFRPTDAMKNFEPQATLDGADADAVSFTLRGKADDEDAPSLRFRGAPAPGGVFGVLHDSLGETITPAVLAPLPPGEPNPGPPTLADDPFQETVRAVSTLAKDAAGMAGVAKQRPHAAAFFTLYPAALQAEAQQGKPPEVLRDLVEDYAAFAAGWGPLAEAQARRSAGAVLVGIPQYREVGEAALDSAVEALPEDAPGGAADRWREQSAAFSERADELDAMRALAERLDGALKEAATDAEAGLDRLRSIYAEEDDLPALYTLVQGLLQFGGEGAAGELRTLYQTHPLDPVVTYGLAEAERRAGRAESARGLFAESAAIPGGMPVVQRLAQQFGEGELLPPRKRLLDDLGDQAAVAELLTETYERLAKGLAGEPLAADDNGRTVLLEMYTGTWCEPCVAADMATAALTETFADEDLLVLHYHVHVPLPDPLTNGDTVERSAAVGLGGTPSAFVDGLLTEFRVGGPVSFADDALASLVAAVEERRAVAPEAALTVTAGAEGDGFTATVLAEREEPFNDAHRLHVAVVEDALTYAGPNGVRRHEMVVRSLPTGATGRRPDDEGRLSFELNSSVTALRDELAAYLASYEAEFDGKRFPDKPLELTALGVAAWVEDTETGAVLQAARAPLGTFAPPPAAEPVDEGTPDAAEGGEPERPSDTEPKGAAEAAPEEPAAETAEANDGSPDAAAASGED